ncbi:MAG: spore cortex biosynthesis protein YabQ [Agathobaculum sp.]|jgi:hypothetical protein|uniref:spore cortex biosynthesis protein YabQ n=1 Tax=Agathobaculum sp. TaxID=2048138 RepID=UPI003D8C6F27
MTLPVQAQFALVLQSVLLGAGLALFYDSLRAVRIYFRLGSVKTALCDTVFCLVMLAAVFEFAIARAAAQTRYYVPAGAAAGTWIYFTLLGSAVRAGWFAVLTAAETLRRWLKKERAKLHALLCRAANVEKITGFTKKFAKPPSIFRRKGLK